METKNGGSRKEERGKKIRRKNKDEHSEGQKEITKVSMKQRDRQKRREERKSKIKNYRGIKGWYWPQGVLSMPIGDTYKSWETTV